MSTPVDRIERHPRRAALAAAVLFVSLTLFVLAVSRVALGGPLLPLSPTTEAAGRLLEIVR